MASITEITTPSVCTSRREEHILANLNTDHHVARYHPSAPTLITCLANAKYATCDLIAIVVAAHPSPQYKVGSVVCTDTTLHIVMLDDIGSVYTITQSQQLVGVTILRNGHNVTLPHVEDVDRLMADILVEAAPKCNPLVAPKTTLGVYADIKTASYLYIDEGEMATLMALIHRKHVLVDTFMHFTDLSKVARIATRMGVYCLEAMPFAYCTLWQEIRRLYAHPITIHVGVPALSDKCYLYGIVSLCLWLGSGTDQCRWSPPTLTVGTIQCTLHVGAESLTYTTTTRTIDVEAPWYFSTTYHMHTPVVRNVMFHNPIPQPLHAICAVEEALTEKIVPNMYPIELSLQVHNIMHTLHVPQLPLPTD